MTNNMAAVRGRFEHWIATPAALQATQLLEGFVAGFLFSRGLVFGKYAPFGVAAVAAVPYSSMWIAVIGAIVGYLLPSAVQIPIRYIASVLAVAAIRWTLSDLKKINAHSFYAPLVTLAPLLATGGAMVAINSSLSQVASMYLAESLLGSGCAYFFQRMGKLLNSGKGFASLSQADLASVTVSVGVGVLAFAGLSIAGVSVGRVLAVLFVLYAARYGGVSAGSVAGIAAGAVFGLSTAGLTYLSGAYALGGLMAGVFAPMGKLAAAAAFVIAHAVASIQVGTPVQNMAGLYETAIASVIFLILPAGGKLSTWFAPPVENLSSDGLRKNVVMKLDYASDALQSVSESVEEISQKLSRVCAPDITGIYRKASQQVCDNCGLRMYCWDRHYNDTMNSFNDMTEILRKKGEIHKEECQGYLKEQCSRMAEVVQTVNSCYQEFLARESAEMRVKQVRAVVADQFGTASELLKDMAQELKLYEQFDYAAAQKVSEVLRERGIMPLDVCCRTDKFNRMSIEAEIARSDHLRMNKGEMAQNLSAALGREFTVPCINLTGRMCRLQVTEKPVFKVRVGAAQHIYGGGTLCGDSYTSFDDGCGRQVIIVSDGMGTGGRAAVDGAMACGIMETLIRAGISYACALKIVNSALLVKSGDESLATLDVVLFDLFSGHADFYKAGAPISFVRKNGQAIEVSVPSLPVGILPDTQVSRTDINLADGDLIAVFSDGVTASGNQWIAKTIEEWKGGDPQSLAERIVERAQNNRIDGHDDDTTAFILTVERYNKITN